MNYHLSANVIVNTLHAMAALQSIASGAEHKALLAPLLCGGRDGMIAEIIRNAFVEVVMKLGPLVSDVNIGDETSGARDFMMSVELITPAGFTTSRHTVIRRALEQTVALTALHHWCQASMAQDSSRDVAASLAASFAATASEWHTTLTTALNPVYPCFTRKLLFEQRL